MDDFDKMFSEVGTGEQPANNNGYDNQQQPASNNNVEQQAPAANGNSYGSQQADKPAYGNSNGNSDDKKQFEKNPAYDKIEGKQKINVWNNDRVEPLELDKGSMMTNIRWVTISLANRMYNLSEEDLKVWDEVIKLLVGKGYRVRVVCSNVKAIHDKLKEAFKGNVMRITGWKGLCKEQTDVKQYLCSDANMQAACFYYKGYQNFPAGIKLVKAATIGSLVGLDNNEMTDMVIVHDRNYNGKGKIDFKSSQQAAEYYMVSKSLELSIYNIANANELDALKQVLA